MTIADTSTVRLAAVPETVQGTTPATPAFINVRYTGESFKIKTETVKSAEVRPDRNVTNLAIVATGAEGGFDFELTYGTFDNYFESLMQSNFSTDTLKNGVLATTNKSFTFEKFFELGATDSYHRFLGAQAGEMSLKIEAGKIITGNIMFMGFSGALATTAIAGSTYTAGGTSAPMNATVDFGGLLMTGLASVPRIISMDVKFTNSLRAQKAVGSAGNVGIGSGQFEVTGSLRAYFENNDLYAAFLAGTPFVLQFTLGSTSGQKYTFALPVVKVMDVSVVSGGNGQDVVADVQFCAIYDSSSTATLTLTRAVA